MLKFIIILVFITYLFFKLGGFILKTVYMILGGGSAAPRQEKSYYRRPADGNVNVDYVPNSQQKGSNPSPGKGEYVDYEEINKK
jgi:hypothetical protein